MLGFIYSNQGLYLAHGPCIRLLGLEFLVFSELQDRRQGFCRHSGRGSVSPLSRYQVNMSWRLMRVHGTRGNLRRAAPGKESSGIVRMSCTPHSGKDGRQTEGWDAPVKLESSGDN